MCRLQKALYGLRRAPIAYIDRFSVFLLNYGFYSGLANSSLFIRHSDQGILVLLLYVDDMHDTGSSSIHALTFLQQLKQEFVIKDLSDVHYFLSVETTRTDTGPFLCQKRYAEKISAKMLMLDCKTAKTPLPSHLVLPIETTSFLDATFYKAIVGSLHYLTFSRPDLCVPIYA